MYDFLCWITKYNYNIIISHWKFVHALMHLLYLVQIIIFKKKTYYLKKNKVNLKEITSTTQQ